MVFALFFLVLAGRTVFFNHSLRQLASHSEEMANVTLVRDQASGGMMTAVDQVALLATAYVAGPNLEIYTRLTGAQEQFHTALSTFATTASQPDLQQLAATAGRQFDDLVRQADRLLTAADRHAGLSEVGADEEIAAWEKALTSYLARFHVLREAINSTLETAITPLTQAEVAANHERIQTELETVRNTSIALGAFAIALMLAAMLMVERRIALPTRRLAAAAEDISAGIEPPPLPATHDDELGRLTATFNEMVRKQSQTLKTLEAKNVEIAAQNDRLLELDRLKDEFVATVSHELRTPLTAIVGYTDLLADSSTGPLSQEQQEFLQVLARNAEQLNQMVDDLLVAARIEAGIPKLERAPFPLIELLQEAIQSALPAAQAKNIILNLGDSEPVTIVGDRTRLGQAIDNLVCNAVKFTPPQGVVEVTNHTSDGQAVVEVRDSGIGIPADEQSHIFDRFYRSSISGSIPGTGIGLWLVKYVATAHGGSIHVQSEVGIGSVFTMQIPVANEIPESVKVDDSMGQRLVHSGLAATSRPREPVADLA
jgi:signal transduction histidine kinase